MRNRFFRDIISIYAEPFSLRRKGVNGNGKKKLSDVKPMHCKTVLNRMNAVYAGSTIRQVFITMGTLFRAAVNNDLITKHPMDGVRYTKAV